MGGVFPGPGSVAGVEFAGAVTRFLLLGPFTEGVVLGRFGLSMVGAMLGTPPDGVIVAASLGPSGDPSQASLDSGVSVVGRSNLIFGRTPAIAIGLDSPQQVGLLLPVGLRVGTGSMFVVVGLQSSSATASGFLTVWIDSFLIGERGGGAPEEQPGRLEASRGL